MSHNSLSPAAGEPNKIRSSAQPWSVATRQNDTKGLPMRMDIGN